MNLVVRRQNLYPNKINVLITKDWEPTLSLEYMFHPYVTYFIVNINLFLIMVAMYLTLYMFGLQEKK